MQSSNNESAFMAQQAKMLDHKRTSPKTSQATMVQIPANTRKIAPENRGWFNCMGSSAIANDSQAMHNKQIYYERRELPNSHENQRIDSYKEHLSSRKMRNTDSEVMEKYADYPKAIKNVESTSGYKSGNSRKHRTARKESPTSFLGMESQVDPKYLESTASRPNEQKRDIKSIEPLSGRGESVSHTPKSSHNVPHMNIEYKPRKVMERRNSDLYNQPIPSATKMYRHTTEVKRHPVKETEESAIYDAVPTPDNYSEW